MCEHLKQLEDYIISKSIAETWRGQAWTNNCREWIYFDCILNTEVLKKKLQLKAFIETHDYFDIKAGSELGFICTICKDGIIGMHPKNPLSQNKVLID